MKAFWIVTAIVVLLGGVAVSRPEVRNWMDQQFPALGINGKKPQELGAAESQIASGSVDGTATAPMGGTFPNQSGALPQTPRLVTIDSQESSLPLLPNPSNGPEGLPSVSQGDSPTLPLPGSAGFSSNNQSTPGNAGGADLNGIPIPTPNIAPQFGVPQEQPRTTARNANGQLVARAATLDFVRKIDVVAQADGIITNLYVDEGSYIKAGAPLLELDSRIAEAEVMVQTRELEQAKLKAGNTAQIDFSKAAYEKAKVDVEISEKLIDKRSEDESTYRAKLLERKKAELQIQVSEIEHAQEVAAVEVSKAKLDAAKVQIELRTVSAPWDGFVSEVAKHQHSYVRAGEMVFTLCDVTKMRVRGNVAADIPPNQLLGAPATVKIQVAPGVERELQGAIGNVSYETKSGEEYNVWVEIQNEQLPDGQFLYRKGMKATLFIQPNR